MPRRFTSSLALGPSAAALMQAARGKVRVGLWFGGSAAQYCRCIRDSRAEAALPFVARRDSVPLGALSSGICIAMPLPTRFCFVFLRSSISAPVTSPPRLAVCQLFSTWYKDHRVDFARLRNGGAQRYQLYRSLASQSNHRLTSLVFPTLTSPRLVPRLRSVPL